MLAFVDILIELGLEFVILFFEEFQGVLELIDFEELFFTYTFEPFVFLLGKLSLLSEGLV